MTVRGGDQRIPRPQSARPGGPAPWAHLGAESRRVTIEAVRRRLSELRGSTPEEAVAAALASGARLAAVLVPLFEEGGEARVILTKRPQTMPSHRGEIAFPGGGYDPSLDAGLMETALREAREEIGLDPDTVEIVAELDTIGTVGSGFVISPFVGVLAARPHLDPHPTEVVKVFDVGLSELMHDDTFREERWDMWVDDVPVHFYELPGETVWGATARILTAFLAHLVEGR